MAEQATFGDFILGLEGLAIMRSWMVDPVTVRSRARKIVEVAAHLDEEPWSTPIAGGERTVTAGYAEWAATYDSPGNPVVLAEEPVVREIVARYPVGAALDAACGSGRHAAYLASLGHRVIGIDATPDMLDLARAKAPTVRFETADLAALPLPDGSVDLAVCALALGAHQGLSPFPLVLTASTGPFQLGSPLAEEATFGDFILGLEGLAIMRSWMVDPVTVRSRARKIVEVAAHLDEEPSRYAEWAATYDSPGNPLVLAEEPVVREIARYPVGCMRLRQACGATPGHALPAQRSRAGVRPELCGPAGASTWRRQLPERVPSGGTRRCPVPGAALGGAGDRRNQIRRRDDRPGGGCGQGSAHRDRVGDAEAAPGGLLTPHSRSAARVY